MAQEGCDDSTKADWASWAYHEYRRLLDEEMMAVCRTYAEGRPADLSVHEGREAQKWLTGAHGVVERAREHISMRLRHLAGAREIGAPLQTPRRVYSYQQQEKRRARVMAYSRTRGARQLGRRRDLSWRKGWTLRPKRQEAASKETLPARVHPAEPR
jgi:hypothetical protein